MLSFGYVSGALAPHLIDVQSRFDTLRSEDSLGALHAQEWRAPLTAAELAGATSNLSVLGASPCLDSELLSEPDFLKELEAVCERPVQPFLQAVQHLA